MIFPMLIHPISRSIQIDHRGTLFPKMEGIGDVPHNDRTGYPVYGSVIESSIHALIEDGIHKTIDAIFSTHLRNIACASCLELNRCMMAGFHNRSNAGQKKGGCPTPAKTLIDAIS